VRVLVVHPGPEFSVSDVYHGWVKGLRQNGVQVAECNLNDRLSFYSSAQMENEAGELRLAFDTEAAMTMAAKGVEVACFEWWPDMVVFVSCLFIPPQVLDVIRSRGIKVAIIHTESPYEDNVQVLRAAHADFNVINDPVNLAMFNEVAPTIYIPHSYDPDLHKPGPADPELKSDFCFVGTGFVSRIEFFSAVDWSGLDVVFAGNWADLNGTPYLPFVIHGLDQCVDNADAVRIYNSTKVSANLYRKEAHRDARCDGWAMGPREVELAATGTFFLREPRGEGDELFDLPTFDGPDDFAEKVRWWASHDDARTEAANRARAAVIDRTFQKHTAELLRLAAA
jgi:spore maturation protein CgeB